MSKSSLNYGEYFSAGNEGGDFVNAAPNAATNGAPKGGPNAAPKGGPNAAPKGGPNAAPKGGASNAPPARNSTAGKQKGGRKRRRKTRKRKRKRKKSGGRRRRPMPDKGWAKLAPFGHARTVMSRKCGKKCFLGPKKSFPICAKGTCKRNRKGIEAAYVRARQWGKPRKSYKSKGKWVTYRGKKGTRRVWMKGSRPRHRRSVYQRVVRRARSLLRRRRRR